MRLPPLGGLYVAGGQNGADPIGCGAFCPPRMEKGRERMMMQIHLNEDDLRDKDGKPITAKKALEMLGFSIEDLRDKDGNLPPEITIRFEKKGAKGRHKPDNKNLESFSYIPPKNHNFPNDKVAKAIRSMTQEEFDSGELVAIELKGNKKKKLSQVETHVTFDTSRLKELGLDKANPFELYVIFTCFAIQAAGNRSTTIPALWRAMTGKAKGEPSKELEKELVQALIKGMSSILTIGPDGIRKAYAKDLRKSDSIGSMLPIEIGPVIMNGQEVERAVIFIGESPLVKVSRLKGGQFATYETALLDVPYNVTRQNVLVAPYMLWHIEDSRRGGVDKSINIDNLIAATGYDGRRDHLAKFIAKCFTHWKAVKHIGRYEIEKDGRGKAIRVRYTLPKVKKELPEGTSQGF